MKLREWQQVEVENWFKSGGVGMNASETGAGKTIIALGSVEISKSETVLIVGPKSTYRSWNDTAEKLLGKSVTRIDGSAKGKRAFSELAFGTTGLYFIGTEMFRTHDWSNVRIDMGIIDEIHKLSTRNSVGLEVLNKFHPRYKLALSATPLRNKLENAWGVLKWLHPKMEYWQPDEDYFKRHSRDTPDTLTSHVTRNVVRQVKLKTGRVVDRKMEENIRLGDCNPIYFWQFAELFFHLRLNWFNDVLEVEREKIVGEVMSRLPYYSRHLKRSKCCEYHPEGFADWPEAEERRVYLPMTAKQKRLYKEIDEQQVVWLDKRPMVVSLSITERLRKAQVALGEMTVGDDGIPFFEDNAKSAKLDWIEENMNDGVLAGEQFVCFTHSRRFAEIASKRLGAFDWSGNTPKQSDRDEAAERFMSGELRVIVAVISAVGTGTDFMQKAQNAVWFSETTDGTDNYQAKGRLDRGGQTKGVIDWVLLSEGTEEAGWMSDRMKKQLMLRGALDK